MSNLSQPFRLGLNGEVHRLEVLWEPQTKQQVIYWDDITRVFPRALHIKNGRTIVSFARNKQSQRCEPHCIKHYPKVVLEVVENDEGLGAQNSSVPITSVTVASTTPSSATSDDLQKSSAQLIRYQQSIQTGQPVKAAAIMHGMQVMRKDMQKEFRVLHSEAAKSSELRALTQRIQDLADAAEAQTRLAEEIHRQSAELQERSLRIQQEALDRLALMQNKVAAILCQNYQLHECPIPRLFVVLPQEGATTETLTRGVRNLVAKQFKLYFLCECGNHTRPSDGKATNPNLKHEIHLAHHEGYYIDRPTEFFDKYGAYILTLLQMLKYGVNIAGVVVPPLGQLNIADGLENVAEGINHVIADIGPRVDSSIAFIEGLTGVQNQLSPSDPNSTSADSAALGGLDVLEGADLRLLEAFLKSSDEGRVLGNLHRIITSEGHVKWVCLDHYRENHRAKAVQDLRDTLEEVGGECSEVTGSITVWLASPIDARRFYSALSLSHFVQELDIELFWNLTMQDWCDLRDAIKLTNLLRLRLKGFGDSLQMFDLFNNYRRFDPVLQMLMGGNVRSLEWDGVEGFLDRISAVPATLLVRKLSIHSNENWSKRASRLVEILRASPSLKELTCWGPGIDLVLDPIVAALKDNKLSHGFTLEVLVKGEIRESSRALVDFEAGTSKILSFDLQIQSEEMNLFRYPSLRNIHISWYLREDLPVLLDSLQKCLEVSVGLESVNIACSHYSQLFKCLPTFQELFARYPHQTTRFSVTNWHQTFTAKNIQDLNTAHLLQRNIGTMDITTGYLNTIPGNCSVTIQTLELESYTTSENIRVLLEFLNSHPTHVQVHTLNISFNNRSDPSNLTALHDALLGYDVLQNAQIHMELTDIADIALFAGPRRSQQESFWRLLYDFPTSLVLSRTLPLLSQSAPLVKQIGPCRLLQKLCLVDQHYPTDQELGLMLSMNERVGEARLGHTKEYQDLGRTSSSPSTIQALDAPSRLHELRLERCQWSDSQWTQLVQVIDVLTLNVLYLDGPIGFTDAHLAVLVDRCISTAARVSTLVATSSEVVSASLQPMSVANQLDVQDFRVRAHQPLEITLYLSIIPEDIVVKERERLRASNIEWVKIERVVPDLSNLKNVL